MKWWEEKRRWRNEPFELLLDSVKAQSPIDETGIVKIENLLAMKVGDQFTRVIYPYFSEDPILPEEGRRLGLHVLSRGLPTVPLADLRILDVLRGSSYGTVDHPLQGDEEEVFTKRYRNVVAEWQTLRGEYP